MKKTKRKSGRRQPYAELALLSVPSLSMNDRSNYMGLLSSFKKPKEDAKVAKKQLNNINKRLSRTEQRLTYLEKTVQVMRRGG